MIKKHYINPHMEKVIDEQIHNKVHRDMLKMRFIDGNTMKEISDKTHYSLQHTKEIIYKAEKILIRYL